MTGILEDVRIFDRSLSRLPRPFRTLLDWALTLCLAVVGVLVFQAEVAKPYRIPTSSMEPTLHCGKPADGCRARVSDRVIANRIVYRFHAPERGDIIVFNAPAAVESACNAGGAYVKRIIGLPGERVSMRSGQVLIDGVRLREPYLAAGYRGGESGEWPRSRQEGYFVLGDNRTMSCDSRRWGTVPRASIIGRVDARYWPPNRAGEP
ncbi:MAG: signal peptidase I [Gaiellaceae bacterium]